MRRTLLVMTDVSNQDSRTYQIRVQGHLDEHWMEWFAGLKISLEKNGDTLLTGEIADQSALHGLFKKIRDLGLPLVSVIWLESDLRTTAADSQS